MVRSLLTRRLYQQVNALRMQLNLLTDEILVLILNIGAIHLNQPAAFSEAWLLGRGIRQHNCHSTITKGETKAPAGSSGGLCDMQTELFRSRGHCSWGPRKGLQELRGHYITGWHGAWSAGLSWTGALLSQTCNDLLVWGRELDGVLWEAISISLLERCPQLFMRGVWRRRSKSRSVGTCLNLMVRGRGYANGWCYIHPKLSSGFH